MSTAQSEELALGVLGRVCADEERLGRFLALSGLDPGSIRRAAAEPGFLPAVLDHVLGDESLVLAIAEELGERPERLGEARRRLAPEPDWDA